MGRRRGGAFHLQPAAAAAAPSSWILSWNEKGITKRVFTEGGFALLPVCLPACCLRFCHMGTNLRFQNDWIYIINRGLPLHPSPPHPAPSARAVCHASSRRKSPRLPREGCDMNVMHPFFCSLRSAPPMRGTKGRGACSGLARARMNGCSASLAFLHERVAARRRSLQSISGALFATICGLLLSPQCLTPPLSSSQPFPPSPSFVPSFPFFVRDRRRSVLASRDRPLFAEKTSYNSRSTTTMTTTTRNIMSRHARIVIGLLISRVTLLLAPPAPPECSAAQGPCDHVRSFFSFFVSEAAFLL